MHTDYEQTTEYNTRGLLGTWYRNPPYVLKRGSYLRYREVDPSSALIVRTPEKITTDILTPEREPTEWEYFELRGIPPPGGVIPTGGEGEWYAPAEEPGLLGAFLDVGGGRLNPTKFADKFGLLGYNQLVPNENKCAGDPLDWFMAHARTVHVIAELTNLLKKVQQRKIAPAKLADYESKIPDGPYALGATVALIPLQQKAEKPVPVAIGTLQHLLNANLGSTARKLQMTEVGGLRNAFTFRALVEVVYWQLADQLVKGSIHQCKECQRIFMSRDPRAEFCPPDPGKKTSRCKSLWTVHRFREKQRNKKKQSRRKR
jgi:hypothetical protein